MSVLCMHISLSETELLATVLLYKHYNIMCKIRYRRMKRLAASAHHTLLVTAIELVMELAKTPHKW